MVGVGELDEYVEGGLHDVLLFGEMLPHDDGHEREERVEVGYILLPLLLLADELLYFLLELGGFEHLAGDGVLSEDELGVE